MSDCPEYEIRRMTAGSARAEFARLRSEREELLGALRGMVRQHGGCLLDPPCGDCITCNAERTLAKCEGRSTGEDATP